MEFAGKIVRISTCKASGLRDKVENVLPPLLII
jgi:hypothetical protein